MVANFQQVSAEGRQRCGGISLNGQWTTGKASHHRFCG